MTRSTTSRLLAILLVATSISSGVFAAPTLARQCSLSVRQTPEFAGTPLQHRRDEHVDDLFRRNGADTVVSEESDGAHSALKDPEVFVSVDYEQRVELSKRGGPVPNKPREGLSDAELGKIMIQQKAVADRLEEIEQGIKTGDLPMAFCEELNNLSKIIEGAIRRIQRSYPEGRMEVISKNHKKCSDLLNEASSSSPAGQYAPPSPTPGSW
ncbi:hypothetical protein F5878DRAFT_243377 [Lentinula raphanica]|uniref:Secreted protein n=1 Tax=Lentinula raphanica TaxID=153919 RepID=A0AA38P690_9AGAR|nr:hypothetical protein F5878DRAFT_243377 [Lentinula raphanica]